MMLHRKCDECQWWAHTQGAAGARKKYGTQYFALCVAIKVNTHEAAPAQACVRVTHPYA